MSDSSLSDLDDLDDTYDDDVEMASDQDMDTGLDDGEGVDNVMQAYS